jgi:ribosomal protein L11 methyltransferase
VSLASSPVLIIRFAPHTTTDARDRMVAALAGHDLIAIHEDDLTAPQVWTAHFATREARDAAMAALRAVPGIEPPGMESSELEDEDWARRTQADLPAIRVGRLVVAPPWDVPAEAPADGGSTIVIEPSRGFGTGHHQSTRLCLVLLQSRDLTRQTAIDVGTGSGVLAIAAAKLGAAFVSAIDVDPDAVENARENIARNGVESRVEGHVRDFTASSMPAADLVTANLTGTLLARHAADLAALVRPGGSAIVAGFTVDERRLVEEAFAPALHVIESAEEDDWWAYVLTRPR